MANTLIEDTDNQGESPEQEFASQDEAVSQEPEVYTTPVDNGPSRALVILVVVVIGILAAVLVYVLNDRKQLKNEVSKLSQIQQIDPTVEAKQLSADVSQLIEIPADESPTVATVVDASKVKTQAFFANAQNGDKVLLYAKSSKAILYRPSSKKIIEVAPINIGNTQTQGTTTTPHNN